MPVYILAGGRSRRYGSDKARAPIDGQPLLVRVAQELEAVASSVTVVARSGSDYDDLGLRTIGDSIPDKGPMGGLLAALEDAGPAEWLLITACDWVGIRVAWARNLLDARSEKHPGGRLIGPTAIIRSSACIIRRRGTTSCGTSTMTMQHLLEDATPARGNAHSIDAGSRWLGQAHQPQTGRWRRTIVAKPRISSGGGWAAIDYALRKGLEIGRSASGSTGACAAVTPARPVRWGWADGVAGW